MESVCTATSCGRSRAKVRRSTVLEYKTTPASTSAPPTHLIICPCFFFLLSIVRTLRRFSSSRFPCGCQQPLFHYPDDSQAFCNDCVHGWAFLSSSPFPALPLAFFPPRVGEVALVLGPPFGSRGGNAMPAKTNCVASYWQEEGNCVPIICLWFANWGLNLLLALFCICFFLSFPFMPSSLFDAYLPFPPTVFSFFFSWKSCKESRLLNPWIYEAVRVSSAHVNLSQYLHLGFTADGKIKTPPNTSPTQFQFHLPDNCQFNQECQFCRYPPSILLLAKKLIFPLICLFAKMTCFRADLLSYSMLSLQPMCLLLLQMHRWDWFWNHAGEGENSRMSRNISVLF